VRVRVVGLVLVVLGEPDAEVPDRPRRVDGVHVPRRHLAERVEQLLVVFVGGVVELDVGPRTRHVVDPASAAFTRGQMPLAPRPPSPGGV